MKKSDAGHSVTEYGPDSRTDLFQVRMKGFFSMGYSLVSMSEACQRMPAKLL